MKQKNVISVSLFLLLSIGQLWAQEQKPYKSAATLKGDTALYLAYNYSLRNAQYKGKTVGEILNELEYPVLYVTGMYQFCVDNHDLLAGLYLYVKQAGNEPSDLSDYYIDISFETPPSLDAYRDASGYSNDNPFPVLSQKLYDFIKDLKVSYVSSNENTIKDPEILKTIIERHRLVREKQYEDLKRAGMPEKEIDQLRKRFKD